jgi:membrane protein
MGRGSGKHPSGAAPEFRRPSPLASVMASGTELAVAGGKGVRNGLFALGGFVRYVLARFIGDGCLTAAAALSYTTLVSLVPLIAIVFAVLSAFPIFADTRDQLLAELFGKFVPEVGAEMDYWFRYFAGAAVKTTTLGILALAVTVVLLLGTVEDQLHNIWHVRSPRPWLQRILSYWAILTLGPLLLGAAFSLPSYLDLVARQHGLDAGMLFASSGTKPLAGILPFLLETLAFTLLYELIPNCAVRWREALAGGVVTALLIDALKVGFVLYISHISSYRAVYGTLASIPIFLLWMYIVWGAVLFGAVVAAAIPRWRADHCDDAVFGAVEQLGLGLALVAELADQTRHGGALSTKVLAERLGVAAAAADDDLAFLQRAGFVVASASGGWALARALDSLTLLDFYRALGLPLAQSLDAASSHPWQARIADALHRIAAVEESALTKSLSEVLAGPQQNAPPQLVRQRR